MIIPISSLIVVLGIVFCAGVILSMAFEKKH